MNIAFTSHSTVPVYIPIELLFWGFVAVYVIHILEESVLGESFVDKVCKNYWPEYSWQKFFGFNAILLTIIIIAILLFDILGGWWIIFPLGLAIERTLNGLWHLGETIVTRKFSSGLLTSVLTWILAYLLVRYALLNAQIPWLDFAIASLLGALFTGLMFGTLFRMRARSKRPA